MKEISETLAKEIDKELELMKIQQKKKRSNKKKRRLTIADACDSLVNQIKKW